MLNIKRIFETIADAGQKILEKKSIKSIAKKRDLLDLCDDLLSTKGAAFGITLARDILFRYQNLSLEDKNKFLIQVNDKYISFDSWLFLTSCRSNCNDLCNFITCNNYFRI